MYKYKHSVKLVVCRTIGNTAASIVFKRHMENVDVVFYTNVSVPESFVFEVTTGQLGLLINFHISTS